VRDFLTLEKLNCLYNKGKHEFQEELDNLDEEVRELLSPYLDSSNPHLASPEGEGNNEE